jgi:hypothetical protein
MRRSGMVAIAALLLASAHASADQPKKDAPKSSPAAAPSAPAALPLAPLAPPRASDADLNLLPLPALVPPPPLDLGLLLKDSTICVAPFVKESAGVSDKAYLESIQKTFFDIANESPLFRKDKDSVVLLAQSAKCEPHDAACISGLGKLAHCQSVLVGSSAAKGNGFVLSVRIFDVKKESVMPGSEVERVLETDRQSDVLAWAEGEACRALQVKCVGRLSIDADRRDMNIYVDNHLAPRGFKTPEQFGVPPGVHEVRITIGQRTSLPKKVAIRRGGFSDLIYARQTEKGGLPLTLSSESAGRKPGPSVDYEEGSWTKPVGYTVAGVGLAVIGIGIAEGLHGKSLANQVNADFAKNHVYLQADVATADSAQSATKTANVLFVVGAVLAAAGITTAFVF